MGAIWLTGEQFIEGLTELVGYKLGVVVTEAELRTALSRAGVADSIPLDGAVTLRIRSEDYEELTGIVLNAFGDPDAASSAGSPVMSVLSNIDGSDYTTAVAVMDAVLAQMHPLIESTPKGQPMDPSPILDAVRAEWGHEGVIFALALLGEMNARMLSSLWSAARRREWNDVAILCDLFTSEATTATLGTFFDQRFVDYLHANFDDIDEIHWRRFEALVGEFLDRAGLQVVLGPGRGDDGVDIRAWVDGEPTATVLVQCKRERRKIAKAVVKALAADVTWEGSRVGLLATTSWWSPGARATAESRAYPVEAGRPGRPTTMDRPDANARSGALARPLTLTPTSTTTVRGALRRHLPVRLIGALVPSRSASRDLAVGRVPLVIVTRRCRWWFGLLHSDGVPEMA